MDAEQNWGRKTNYNVRLNTIEFGERDFYGC